MSELEYYFKRILKKQEQIGYKMADYLNIGLDQEEISKFEHQFNIGFNDEYKIYLTLCSGVHEITATNWKSLSILPNDFRLVSIVDLSEQLEKKQFQLILIDYEVYNMSALHIPIIIQEIPEALWVNIDKNDAYYGYILETAKGWKPEYIYPSMTRMFETICVAYELGVIFYDMSYKGIDIDYHKFGEIAKKINPEMEYWKDW